jgi:DHA2 family multidrug resistance protein-like MFS transporter
MHWDALNPIGYQLILKPLLEFGRLFSSGLAFTTAVQFGYGFGALVLAPVGVAVLWLLRHTRLDATEETGTADAAEGGPEESAEAGAGVRGG